jgi:hypothetical protein
MISGSNISVICKSGLNGAIGLGSSLGVVYVSYLDTLEAYLRVGGMILGLGVTFATLGITLKTLGFHLPGYDWLLKKFGHRKKTL